MDEPPAGEPANDAPGALVESASGTPGLAEFFSDETQRDVHSLIRATGCPGVDFIGSGQSAFPREAMASSYVPVLDAIAAIESKAELTSTMATLQTQGVDVGFGYGPQVDPHDAAHYVAWFDQGGLGLPDRDYYLNEGKSADSLRTAYVQHIARTLLLGGESRSRARAAARRIMALETEMARATLTRVQRRDPAATDHPMSAAALRALAPALDWPVYLRTVGMARPVERVNVAEPEFFKRLGALLETTPLADWKAYLRYHALAEASPWLSSPFVKEDFAFSSRFTGAKQLLPRWKRCLRATDGLIGEALGQAYVAKTFSPQARARARQVIDDIRGAFGERVRLLDWMSDTTKAQALHKLTVMHEKVGYPERWRDYAPALLGLAKTPLSPEELLSIKEKYESGEYTEDIVRRIEKKYAVSIIQ